MHVHYTLEFSFGPAYGRANSKEEFLQQMQLFAAFPCPVMLTVEGCSTPTSFWKFGTQETLMQGAEELAAKFWPFKRELCGCLKLAVNEAIQKEYGTRARRIDHAYEEVLRTLLINKAN